MNITGSEQPIKVIAKTCGCKGKGTTITYSFIDGYHSLCIDKKEIILSELDACESLSTHTADDGDKKVVEQEIAELKMALDLMH